MMSITKKGAAVAGALLASLLVLSGCSGTDTGSQAGGGGGDTAAADLSAAQALLGEATAEVKSFDFPTESVEPAKDLFVVGIPCAYAAEGCKRGVDAIEEAAGQLGWKYQMIDPAGDPEQMRSAVRTAIQLGADAIFLAATPPAVVKDDVKAAQEAGITVINMYEPADGDFADASALSDRVEQGAWAAAFLTVATEGAGKIAIINDPEFPSIVAEHKGLTEALPELCPGCEVVRDFDFQIANLQTQVPTDFQAVLTANPNLDAVWAAYDPVAAAILPVIDRADRTDSITVVSHNGDPFALEYIQSGDTSLQATAAYNMEWQSYMAVDQLLRIKAGTITDAQRIAYVPSKLLTAENITSIPWDGDIDWKSEYLKLWGVS